MRHASASVTLLVFASLAILVASCSAAQRADAPADQTGAARSPNAGPLAWTVGDWRGVRVDGADGTEAPITVSVRSILGGAGLEEDLEVRAPSGGYRGFSVQVMEKDRPGRWVRMYVNATRRDFVRIEGEVDSDGARGVWRSTTPGRTSESQMVSVRAGARGWTRTMLVSDDGGKTWRVLWEDRLHRAE